MTARRREDLHARRNATFAGEFICTHADGSPVDFTDADAVLEVRLHGAAPGDALIRLEVVADPALQGLYLSEGSIQYRAHEVEMELLPSARVSASSSFVFDLVVTLPDTVPSNWRWGTLHLAAGVTRRISFITAGGAPLVAGGAYLIAG